MMENLVWWAISFCFVLALILGFALLLKKFALPGAARGPIFRKGSMRRLEVLESLPLDPKTRLMLVRRDDTNHLILIGGNNELVVEKNITPKPALTSQRRKDSELAGDNPESFAAKDNQSSFDDGPADSGGDGGD